MAKKPSYAELEQRVRALEQAEARHKDSELALEENEQKYRNLVNNLPGTAYQYVLNAEGEYCFAYIGDNCRDLFGLSAQDILQDASAVFNLIPQPDAAMVSEAIRQSAETLTRYEMEHRIVKNNGETVWIYASSIPRMLSNGDILWDGIGLDITKRKLVETEVDNNRRLLLEAEKLANLGAWEWDIASDTWSLSDTWRRIHGCSNTQLTTAELLPIAHPDDRELIQKTFQQTLQSGHLYQIEHRIHRQDTGEERCIKAYGDLRTDQSGNPVKLIGAAQDITQQKQTEQALRDSVAKYRLLADNTEDVIFTLDMNLQYTYVSPSVQLLRGYDPSELMGESIEQSLTPESLALAKEIFAKETTLEQQHGPAPRPARVLELQMQHKDGTSLWTEVKVSLLRNEAGTPTGILGVNRDISARKRAEAALKASEERFRNMADLLPGAVVETDHDLQVSYVNQHGLKLFGYSQADVENGMHVFDFLHPEDREKAAQRIASYFEDRQTEATEYRILKKNGESTWVLLNTTPVKKNGHLVGFHSVLIDISQRKHAEEERESLIQELRKALSEVRELRGFLPICSNCKKIRDDDGYWQRIEKYIQERTDTEFSHGICPECAKQLYPDLDLSEE